MRLTGKRIIGLCAIAYGIYLIIDVFGNHPEGLGPVFRDWWSGTPAQTAAPADAHGVPVPSAPLHR